MIKDKKMDLSKVTFDELTLKDADRPRKVIQNTLSEIGRGYEKVNDDKKFDEYWTPRLTEIIERYLGKGKKVNQCTRAQVEALDLIVSDLREVIKNV